MLLLESLGEIVRNELSFDLPRLPVGELCLVRDELGEQRVVLRRQRVERRSRHDAATASSSSSGDGGVNDNSARAALLSDVVFERDDALLHRVALGGELVA